MNPANPLNLPARLPLARYRFGFWLDTPLQLPPHAASTLRGVLGRALMSQGLEKAIFSPPADTRLNSSQQQTPPSAYIIETPTNGRPRHPAGDIYCFDMVLMGGLRHHLPLIIWGFEQAFQNGVGKAKGKGRLAHIQVETPNGWQHILTDRLIACHDDKINLPPPLGGRQVLEFVTPLRLQQQGRIINEGRFSVPVMLSQLMRRVSAISTLYFGHVIEADFAALAESAKQVRCRHSLRWHDWERYSNRQGQKMNIGGLMGTCEMDNIPLQYGQLLQLGRWLHIGKETVFGHGRYLLKNS